MTFERNEAIIKSFEGALERYRIPLYVLSDSLGELGTSLAKMLQKQFDGAFGHVKRFPFLTTIQEIEEILSSVASSKCLIIYTLVLPETRNYIKTRSEELGLTTVDFFGEALDKAALLSGVEPLHEAGLNRVLDKSYYQRIAAIEFAVKHDDGTDPTALEKADVVLAGISRTSKTPLSMYLGFHDYKTANVPLIPGVEPPEELFMVPKEKVFGLTNDLERLLVIRTNRLRDLGIPNSEVYANPKTIQDEIDHANRIFERIGCEVINVAQKSIEETAVMIITRLNLTKNGGL